MGRLVRIRTAVIQLSSGTVLVIKVKKQKKKTEIFRVYKDFEKKKTANKHKMFTMFV